MACSNDQDKDEGALSTTELDEDLQIDEEVAYKVTGGGGGTLGVAPGSGTPSHRQRAPVRGVAVGLEAQFVTQRRHHALNSRVVIEQAKRIVTDRGGLDMEQASTSLRNHAPNHNLPSWSSLKILSMAPSLRQF
jgi:hypothetical protein